MLKKNEIWDLIISILDIKDYNEIKSKNICQKIDTLDQCSPTFSAPGTSFMKDNFSTDGWRGGWFTW